MAGADACTGCGTELSPDARYCVKCGRTRSAPLLDLPRIDETPPTESRVERAVVERRRGRRPSGSALALVALLVVLVGAVVLLSGGDGGGDDEANEPTTTQPTETTRRPRRTTTTQPPVMTGVINAPVLGTPTDGLSLYAVSGDHLARVDLDTGEVVVVRDAFQGTGGYTSAAIVQGEHLLVGRDRGVYVVGPDVTQPPIQLDDLNLETANGSGRALSMEWDPFSGRVLTVREFAADGRIVNEWAPPSTGWVVGAIGDRLALQVAGSIYLVHPDGAAERFAVGEAIAFGGTQLLWRHCDERMQCGISITDLATGDSTPLPLDDERAAGGYFAQGLAPDGRTLVISGPDGLQLIDVATGEALTGFDPPATGVVAWSPDGAWVFSAGVGNAFVAFSTHGLDPVGIALPEGLAFSGSDLVLAVG